MPWAKVALVHWCGPGFRKPQTNRVTVVIIVDVTAVVVMYSLAVPPGLPRIRTSAPASFLVLGAAFTSGGGVRIATRHQRMQPPAPTRPQRFPTALSNICCVPQSPRGSVCFPIKLVSRVRLVVLKIEDRRRLRGDLVPKAVRPRFLPRRSGPEAPPPVFGFRKMSNSLCSSGFVGGNFPPGRSRCVKLQVNSKDLWEVGFYLFLVKTDGTQVECWAGRNRTSAASRRVTSHRTPTPRDVCRLWMRFCLGGMLGGHGHSSSPLPIRPPPPPRDPATTKLPVRSWGYCI